jgi:type IV fimbrial biogenesis protein FimT
MRFAKGFTLIELMVTIAVLAIIITLATPGLTGLIDSSSARSQTNQYRDMLTYARSEAINRGQPVRVKRLASGAWVVGTGDPADCEAATALRCFPAPRGDLAIATTIPAAGLVFTSQGQVRGQAITDSVSLTITFAKHCQSSRVLTVNGIGRIRSVPVTCV